MITTPYYTYHEESIKTLIIVDYLKFSHKIKRYSRSKKNYLVDCWLNTLIFNFRSYSVNNLLKIIKITGFNYPGYDDEYLINHIKTYNNNSNHYYTKSHFEWDYNKLYKDFGEKQYVDKYMCQIRNKHAAEKKLNINKQIVFNLYENRDFRIEDMIKKLQGKIKDKRTIKKALKANNITIEKKSKSFILIENRIDDVLKELEGKKITDKIIAEKIGVSIGTYKRWKRIKNEQFRS